MVFRGELSKACAECRAKKTRCDSHRPECGQCRRLGRVCSGYRRIEEIRFLDQTSEVKAKVKHLNSLALTPFEAHSISSSGSPPIISFPDPSYWMENDAKAFFFDEFVDVFNDSKKTELSYIPSAYKAAPSGGMLDEMITALGLIALSGKRSSSNVEMMAVKKYSSALTRTRTALTDSVRMSSAETLATVLLLSLHEAIVFEQPTTLNSDLPVHLDGAIRLLHYQGRRPPFDTCDDSRMFHAISSQTAYSCLHRRCEIPQSLLAFQDRVEPTFHAEERTSCNLMKLTSRLCTILSMPMSNTIAEIKQSYHNLLQLDDELAAHPATLSWRFSSRRVPCTTEVFAYFDDYDTYLNHVSASSWNRWRTTRIVLHEEVIRLINLHETALLDAGEDTSAQKTRSACTIQDMATGICYSLPFFLGPGADGKFPPARMIGRTPRITMYGGISCMMPIYIAASKDYIPATMYDWLLAMLSKICTDTGIVQARHLLVSKQGHDRPFQETLELDQRHHITSVT